MIEPLPYYTEQYQIGRFLVRKTRGQTSWLRFQAGRNEAEERHYISRAMHGGGRFHESVVLYHLLGFGETEDEALTMAINRK